MELFKLLVTMKGIFCIQEIPPGPYTYVFSVFLSINKRYHNSYLILKFPVKNVMLQAYDLGADGSNFKCIGSMTLEGIVNEVIKVSKKTLEPNLVKKVLTIAPIKLGILWNLMQA